MLPILIPLYFIRRNFNLKTLSLSPNNKKIKRNTRSLSFRERKRRSSYSDDEDVDISKLEEALAPLDLEKETEPSLDYIPAEVIPLDNKVM